MPGRKRPAASSRAVAAPRAVRKNPLRVAGDPVPVIGTYSGASGAVATVRLRTAYTPREISSV